VKETFEFAVAAPDLVPLQGRQPSLEGTGEVTLRRLVKEALRMRPDHLVVGEVRDAEALDLLLAPNTGVLEYAIRPSRCQSPPRGRFRWLRWLKPTNSSKRSAKVRRDRVETSR
jgi:hypothetical protein